MSNFKYLLSQCCHTVEYLGDKNLPSAMDPVALTVYIAKLAAAMNLARENTYNEKFIFLEKDQIVHALFTGTSTIWSCTVLLDLMSSNPEILIICCFRMKYSFVLIVRIVTNTFFLEQISFRCLSVLSN